MARTVTVTPETEPPTTSTAPVGPGGSGGPTLARRVVPLFLRVASHAVVWTLVLVPTVIQLADGWRAVRDDAMISIGAYRVFSSHSPTVGVWSQASQGMRHAFYDLGPLLFWLLAVPVRLDPDHGAMWGAALLCGAALSVAVEAAWSVKRWPASVAVGLIVADVGWQTQLFADLVWNPHFGLVFLMAAAVTAWAVASGRFGWWPVVVLFASVAAQCHLLYALPSVALAVLAPVVALACGHRPPRRRWLVTGLVVGAVCWVVPLAQQVFGRPGNLALVLGSGSTRARIGVGFGLHTLATAVTPHPIWLSSFPFLSVPQFLDSHSESWAVASLVLLAAVAVGAWGARRRELAALAVIGLVLAAGTVASFASLPKDDVIVVSYLAIDLWAVGALVWIVVLWAVAEVGTAAGRRLPHPRHALGRWAFVRHGLEVAGLVLLVLVGTEGVRSLVPAAHNRVADIRLDAPLDEAIARSVQRSVAPGPVAIRVRPAASFGPAAGGYVVDYWGMAFVLLARGWQPGLTSGFFGVATHLSVPTGTHWPVVTVTVHPADKVITGVTVEPGPQTPTSGP